VIKLMKPIAAVLILTLVGSQPCIYAASIPSKTAKDQALACLATDLAVARIQFASDRIVNELLAQGLTEEQIGVRLARLSTADLISLAENPAQIQAAGITMTRRMWTIAGIAAGALIVGGLALHGDDEEDDDDSDDGED
jgi:hypothetical protein